MPVDVMKARFDAPIIGKLETLLRLFCRRSNSDSVSLSLTIFTEELFELLLSEVSIFSSKEFSIYSVSCVFA